MLIVVNAGRCLNTIPTIMRQLFPYTPKTATILLKENRMSKSKDKPKKEKKKPKKKKKFVQPFGFGRSAGRPTMVHPSKKVYKRETQKDDS